MSNAARFGVFGLMALAIALSRLIEVEVRPQPLRVEAQASPTPSAAHAPLASRGPGPAPVAPGPVAPAPPARSQQRTYVVQKGDILGKISKKAYGTTRHWRAILAANKDQIPDESKLRPGMVLKLPEIPKTD